MNRKIRTTSASVVVAALVLTATAGQASIAADSANDPDSLLSREEHLAEVLGGLPQESAAAATEITGKEWTPEADPEAEPLPADLPVEDAVRIVLATASGEADGDAEVDEGAAPAAARLAALEGEPTPERIVATPDDVVPVGGMDVKVGPAEDALAPTEIKLEVHGQDTTPEDETGVRVSITDLSETAPDPENPRSLKVTFSYEDFVGAAGGDWAARLRLVRYPDCAPDLDESVDAVCQPIPVEGSINTLDDFTVTAEVELGELDSQAPDEEPDGDGTVAEGRVAASSSRLATAAAAAASPSTATFGLAAGTAGQAGDWGATSLAPSSSWGTSGNTGSFTWSYPFTMPAVPGGGEPELALSYSSAASDGRVPSANNQASWVGEGFELTSSYVERRYAPCGDDKKKVDGNEANNKSIVTADLCWGTENATLALNGSSTELVKDKESGTWHSKNEDGSLIELKGKPNGGGGEHWVVTTVDGSRYFFGHDDDLESAWKVPVFGNHKGEPCYQAVYVDSKCDQVWRWNLDYVVDPLGNTTTYRYDADKAAYQMFLYDSKKDPWGEHVDKKVLEYNPGGYLKQIAYGTHTDTPDAKAPAIADFAVATRCEPGAGVDCGIDKMHKSKKNKIAWPDVPTDLFCAPGSKSCKGQSSPVFFDRYRLASVTTKTYDGSAYQPVDSWRFDHKFDNHNTYVATGGSKGSGKILRLDKLTHTGHGGTATAADDIAQAPVVFEWEQKRNRVRNDGLPMYRPRLGSVVSESGARTVVTYADQECTASNLPKADDGDNKKRCYAVDWDPEGETKKKKDWFHKYVVKSVVEHGASTRDGKDLVTGSQAKTTEYVYDDGGVTWAKPTGALVKAKGATYSDFRGYASVTTLEGEGAERSASRATYFRGTGANLAGGPDGHKVTVKDEEPFAGRVFVAEELLLEGGDPTRASVISSTVTKPSGFVKTATSESTPQNEDGITAGYVASTEARGFTFDSSGSVVDRTATVTTVNSKAQVKRIEDRGREGTSADDVCTTVVYAHENGSGVGEDVRARLKAANQVTLAARTTERAGTCSGADGEILSDSLADYNADGLVTRTWELKADHDPASTPDPVARTGYDLTAAKSSYDRWGRAAASSDALGRTTRTAYVHSPGGLVQEIRVTAPNPADKDAASAFVSTTVHNPLTGDVIETRDANGRRTTGRYDALSRLVEVRYPDRQSSSVKPSIEYSYLVEKTGLNAVVTKTIGADGVTQHVTSTLYDGLMRPFQEQVEGADAGAAHTASAQSRGRIVTHTMYDSAGRVSYVTGKWWATGTPASKPVQPPAVTKAHTTYVYDGAGRVTDEILWNGTSSNPDYEQHRTVTSYDGRYTTVVPPAGGTATTTVVDAHGRTAELREHLSRPAVSKGTKGRSSTLPGFDAAKEPAGSYQATTYGYDRSGQMVTMKDPAGNTWTKSYDTAGRVVKATDPDSGTTVTAYDKAGQVVSVRNGNGKTLTYEYDFLGRKTRLAEAGVTKATWAYDTAKDSGGKAVLGAPASSTRVEGGNSYVSAVDTYDLMGRTLSERTVLPAVGDLARLTNRTFTTSYTYTADGQLKSLTYPQITQQGSSGGATVLGKETVTTQFDVASKPHWSGGGFGWGVYVAESRHSALNQLKAMDLGNTYGAVVTYAYDEVTERLTGISLDRERISGTDVELTYAYDDAGNITSIGDTPTNAAVKSGAERQCFTYDGLRRLTSAWTVGGSAGCAPAGSVVASALGGPAPYWNQYSYDKLGNRTKLVEKGTKTTTYAHGAGLAGPHAVTSMSTVEGSTTTASTFTYDPMGNQISRKIGSAAAKALSWDGQGQLAGVSVAGSASTLEAGEAGFVYDASGGRLVRAEARGTTVYLPGGQELFVPVSGSVSATRYYSFAGQTVAVRTGAGLGGVFSLMADVHGTPVAAWANTRWTTSSVARLRTDPFGGARGGSSSASIPGDRQFLGKTRDDSTGLTQLGARYFDELTGRFVSVDPVLQPQVPAQFNAYVYSGNNPVTWADPTGLFWGGIRSAWNATTRFVGRHQATIVGAVVGAAAFTGCLAVAGVTTMGVGAIGCGAAAGAASGAVSNLWRTKVQKAAPFSWGGLAKETAFGAAAGAAGVGVGAVASKVVPAAASKVGAALSSATKRVTIKPAAASKPVKLAARSGERGSSRELRMSGSSTVGGMDHATKSMTKYSAKHPEPGMYDVIGHGSPNDIAGRSASEVADRIRGSIGGQDVRLLSCQTGCPSGTFAQDLANSLGVRVKAPTTDIGASARGNTLTIFDGGEWKWFNPNS